MVVDTPPGLAGVNTTQRNMDITNMMTRWLVTCQYSIRMGSRLKKNNNNKKKLASIEKSGIYILLL